MNTIILTHFSKEPLGDLKPVHEQPVNLKPRGLWLSDENQKESWKRWCQNEKFELKKLACATEFEVDASKVLYLKYYSELASFAAKFSDRPHYSVGYGFYIDWAKIAKNYAGILITPYQWQARCAPMCSWYYSWDCASACIWDVSCLKKLGK